MATPPHIAVPGRVASLPGRVAAPPHIAVPGRVAGLTVTCRKPMEKAVPDLFHSGETEVQGLRGDQDSWLQSTPSQLVRLLQSSPTKGHSWEAPWAGSAGLLGTLIQPC